jgi:hypothetical protein
VIWPYLVKAVMELKKRRNICTYVIKYLYKANDVARAALPWTKILAQLCTDLVVVVEYYC